MDLEVLRTVKCGSETLPAIGTTQQAIVGLDLATTRSEIAVVENGVPRILPNLLGEPYTRSSVLVDEDHTMHISTAAVKEFMTGKYKAGDLVEVMKRLRGAK